MKGKSVLGFSKNVRSLGWVSLFNDISSEMIYPLLPLFLTQVLGAGVIFVGLIEGIAESVSSFSKTLLRLVFRPISKEEGDHPLRIFPRLRNPAVYGAGHLSLPRSLSPVF